MQITLPLSLSLMLASSMNLSSNPINELFVEDFEFPVVSGYDEQPPTPAGWVSAAQGFGSGRHGLNNKDGGDFTAPAGNDQVICFRYTNSGITTGEGVIGPLIGDATYTVTFDVVADNPNTTATPYTVRLIAFGPGAARDDCRSTPAGSTILASSTGNAQTNGSWTTSITITFYADPTTYAAELGNDLGIRMIGNSNTANIDNVKVMDDIPPAGTVVTLH